MPEAVECSRDVHIDTSGAMHAVISQPCLSIYEDPIRWHVSRLHEELFLKVNVLSFLRIAAVGVGVPKLLGLTITPLLTVSFTPLTCRRNIERSCQVLLQAHELAEFLVNRVEAGSTSSRPPATRLGPHARPEMSVRALGLCRNNFAMMASFGMSRSRVQARVVFETPPVFVSATSSKSV